MAHLGMRAVRACTVHRSILPNVIFNTQQRCNIIAFPSHETQKIFGEENGEASNVIVCGTCKYHCI